MFTECPGCKSAFRVTAKVLQQARGRVRCGGCGNAFSALDFLSEDLPTTEESADNTRGAFGDAPSMPDKLSESSRLLLAKLDELAGSDDVLIEDTGTEWRVLNALVADIEADKLANEGTASAAPEDAWMATPEIGNDDDSAVASTSDEAAAATSLVVDELQASLDLDIEPQAAGDGWRFDDHTPHPDAQDDEDEAAYAVPQRRAEDQIDLTESQQVDENQTDFILSEPGDWSDVLDEVRGIASEPPQPAADNIIADEYGPARDDNAAMDNDSDEPVLHDADTGADNTEIASAEPESGDEDVDDDEEMPAAAASGDDDEVAHDAAREVGDDVALEEAVWPEASADDDNDEEDLAGDADSADSFAGAAWSEATTDDDGDDQGMASEAVAGEVDDDVAPDDIDAASTSLEVEAELAAIHSELTTKEVTSPADVELRFEVEPDGTEPPVLDKLMAADGTDSELAVLDGGDGPDNADHAEPDERMRMFDDESAVETIIMEGESIRSAIEQEQLDSLADRLEKDQQSSLADSVDEVDGADFDPADTLHGTGTSMRGGRRRTDPPGYGVIAGTVVLVLLLAGQLIHTYRQSLSTYGLFNQTIGPVYRLLGNPVTPEWNIQGWQFESTNGNVASDGDVLTVVSRIRNRSTSELPYPLVHISLTDRWEEIIGSRVLTSGEYLAGNADPERLVKPGAEFTAVITVDDPAAEATGFKLNVCYRDSPGRIRCATEDFKD